MDEIAIDIVHCGTIQLKIINRDILNQSLLFIENTALGMALY